MSGAPTGPVAEGRPPIDVPARRVEDELRKRLVWLTASRIVVITLVLTGGSYFLLQKEGLGSQRAAALGVLVLGVNLLQLLIALLLRAGYRLVRLAAVQVAGDWIFALALLFLTGLVDSLFAFVLPLVAVSGGALLGERGAWITALAAFGGYALLVVLAHHGVLIPPGLESAVRTTTVLRELFIQGSAVFLTAGLVAYLGSQARTAGERAEEAESVLLQLHALQDAILRSTTSGVLTTNRRGEINYVNPAGEQILGLGLDRLRGRSLHEIFPADRGVTETSRSPREETEWKTPHGRKRVLGFHLTPLLDPGGRRLGTLAVFQDLTELKELQERASRSERLALVGELAANLAHELRNPMASIYGAIELLRQDASGEQDALFAIVLREAERLNRLVSEFLAFASPQPPRLEPVDLCALVKDTLEAFALDPQAKELRLESELSSGVALADEDQMSQVLWNLLVNAAQASRPGGRVIVRCREEGDRVVLSVEDEGCGIPGDLREKIFDPFFTTKETGSGLGLPMVHRVVESLGGSIELRSEVGEGTCFTISLPRASAESARRAVGKA